MTPLQKGWLLAMTTLVLVAACKESSAPPAAAKLVFLEQPSDALRGDSIQPKIQVAAQDESGTLVTGFTGKVSLRLGANPTGDTLLGTTTVNAVEGVAYFLDLRLNHLGSGYTLIASSGALLGATSAPFAIVKAMGTLQITSSTSGTPLTAPAYAACIDPVIDTNGGTSCAYDGLQSLLNSLVDVTVDVGPHTVLLTGLASNCWVVGPNPATVTVVRDRYLTVPFFVSCAQPPLRNLRVSTTTTGTDAPSAYELCIDPRTDYYQSSYCAFEPSIGVNSPPTIVPTSAGSHVVELIVPNNCIVSATNTRTVNVTADVTVDLAFNVSCALVERIALTVGGVITVMGTSGSLVPVIVGHGLAPAWSPDGASMAYECDRDICVVNGDRFATPVRLTTDVANNTHPTWSPDGLKIAFSAVHPRPELYVVAANGSGVVQLTQNVGFRGSPAWSPDGKRIAFDCQVDAGNDDICSVNADGTGFTRLTNDPARDYGAAWKPDGSVLAFATKRYGTDEIALLNVASGSVTRIGSGLPGFAPSWSPDGTQFAFVQFVNDYYDYSSYDEVLVAKADGSNVRDVVTGDQPAWKPHL